MSTWKKLLNRIIYPSSLVFTVVSIAIYVFWAADDTTKKNALTTKEAAWLFFFLLGYALFVSFVSCVFFTEIITPLKFIIHFGSLFIALWIAAKRIMPTTYYIVLIIFVVLYLAIAVPATIVYSKKKKEKNAKKDYKKMFSK